MKTLYWGSKDPLDVFGNPNCRWGSPSYRLEKGDPGYVEWYPPGTRPPSRRRRRASLSATDPEPTTTPAHMDPYFHYNVIPKTGGGFTTRVVTQEDLLTPELVATTLAALAARGITLTAEQLTAAGEELSKTRIAALARGRTVRRAFGYFTQEPTCGGSHTDADFTPDVGNMNVAVRGRLAPAGQDLYESLIQFQRDGVMGEKAPTINRVYDSTSRLTDRITLGGPFRISGPEAFGPEPDPAATTLGLFLERTGGTPVRIGVFSRWTDTEIFGSWPAALTGTGTAELRIVVRYVNNAGPSTFIYGTPLTVV